LKDTPRALTLRQPALRPAHFMRAVFFSPSHAMGDVEPTLCSDTVRTSSAVAALQNAMHRIGLMAPKRWPSVPASVSGPAPNFETEFLVDAVHEVARRAACQLARTRARRLMHGELTASNITLDGRWLDFATISAVSDYGRVTLPPNAPDFMHEELLLLPSLLDFAFYVFKFSPAMRQRFPTAQHLAGSMQAAFDSQLASRLRIEFVRLLGYTQAEVARCPARLLDATCSAMMAVARAGNRAPFSILRPDNDFYPSMPARMGTHHLPTILTVLACANDGAWADAALAPHLADARLRQALIAAWLPMRQSLERHDDPGSPGRRRLWRAFEALRLNAPHDALYRTKLYPAIESLLEGGQGEAQSVQRFVDDAVAYGADWLGDTVDGMPTLRFRGLGSSTCLEFHPHEGLSLAGGHTSPQALFQTLQSVASAPPEFITAMQAAHAQEFSARL
jgi:hypothetical protein